MADKAKQAQHVDVYRKRILRRSLLRDAVPGPAYVPFIGDGDLAADLYADRLIFGADLDPERVKTARLRRAIFTGTLLHGKIIVADCNGWPFPDYTGPPFAVADFDAYSDPYESFRAFWQHAPKADRLALFFTDGHRQGIIRTANLIRPDGTHEKIVGTNAKRTVYNFYWQRTVRPWFNVFMADAGWTVKRSQHLRGSSMLYWGSIVERVA
jgi:hypothetical protein